MGGPKGEDSANIKVSPWSDKGTRQGPSAAADVFYPDGTESGSLPLALANFFHAELYDVLLSHALFWIGKESMAPTPSGASKAPRFETLSPFLAVRGGFG